MTTQAILEGMGVGRADISALQATVQWIIRDGASMVGSLLFTSLSSKQFGQNVKSWRLFADFINNVGITLEMIAPVTNGGFLLLICLASVCKALCGVAAGASGAAISEHWGSKKGNIADVLAKNSAQHTLVGLVGLVFSIPFAKLANVNRQRAWMIYGILTCVHMYTNYMAMKSLALRSINESRLRVLLENYMAIPAIKEYIDAQIDNLYTKGQDTVQSADIHFNSTSLSPAAIAEGDKIVYPILPRWFQILLARERVFIKFAEPLSSSLALVSVDELGKIFSIFDQTPYIILFSKVSNIIIVSFKEGASVNDGIKGMLTARILKCFIESPKCVNNTTTSDSTYKISMKIAETLNIILLQSLEDCDWDLKRNSLFPFGMQLFKYKHN